jgi:hypothetical protein
MSIYTIESGIRGMLGLLGGENIAEEDLLDIFGLDARSLNGSCDAVRIGH